MKNLRITTATIKGIGGEATMIKGVGEISITLESDDGHKDTIRIYDAVYVPSSSYNLLSPQLLLDRMKTLGYAMQPCTHDDIIYCFHYL